jgi:hypothetical protein
MGQRLMKGLPKVEEVIENCKDEFTMKNYIFAKLQHESTEV